MPGWCQLAAPFREQRSRLFVGQHVSFSWVYFRRARRALSGAPATGRGTNINTKPPVNKAAGTSSCDPRTGLRDATLRIPCCGLGYHYFRCSVHPLPSCAQGPLKFAGHSGASEALLFHAASSLSVGNTNDQACQARSISAYQPTAPARANNTYSAA